MIHTGWIGLLVAAFTALIGCQSVEPVSVPEPSAPDVTAPPQEIAAYHLVEDGRRQLESGQVTAAVAAFQKALALAPSSPHANLALAEAKLQQGAIKSVFVYADRVDRITGNDPEWRWRVALIRAQAFEQSGDTEHALGEYRRVLTMYPGNQRALAGLARLTAGTDSDFESGAPDRSDSRPGLAPTSP